MRLYLALLLMLSVAACGYKGPLYLPQPKTTQAAPATPQPTPTPSPTPTTEKGKP